MRRFVLLLLFFSCCAFTTLKFQNCSSIVPIVLRSVALISALSNRIKLVPTTYFLSLFIFISLGCFML